MEERHEIPVEEARHEEQQQPATADSHESEAQPATADSHESEAQPATADSHESEAQRQEGVKKPSSTPKTIRLATISKLLEKRLKWRE